MAADVFVDTSGLYALADQRDPLCDLARRQVDLRVRGGSRLVITDYILDEACTLAKARAGSYAALRLLSLVEQSAGFRMEWIAQDRFDTAKDYFRKHADHDYSFTDCTSFVVMKELGLRVGPPISTAEAGFGRLLA